MPVLDFKEIPTAARGALRDQFELFACEFLECLGFRTIVGPDRGPDAGRDLIVEEVRAGIAGETRVKWLVSCKHNAHTDASVTPEDEPDIHDRVATHNCKGFIGFYSTIPSSGLAAKLNAQNPFEVQVYNSERIERELLKSSAGFELARRFFPKSFAAWQREHPEPAKLLFSEKPTLVCFNCRTSLLLPKPHGIVVIWSSDEAQTRRQRTEHLYWCCKGNCDEVLQKHFRQDGLNDGWEDIPDLIIPMTFIRWILVSFNEFHRGMTYSDDALKNAKDLMLNIFPLVSREMTEEEKDRIKKLMTFPSVFGGWGYDC